MITASRVSRAGDDEAVLVERSDRLRLDYDHAVILAILDDLMFTSKIRRAAGARRRQPSPSRARRRAALEQMRARHRRW